MGKILLLFYSLTARVIRVPQKISQPVSSIFLCSALPLGLGELQTCSFSDVVFPLLFLCALSSSPFYVPCKMVLVRPDEGDTFPYHYSLRLFTMVRRSSCAPNVCWILAMIGREFAPLTIMNNEDADMDSVITTFNAAVTETANLANIIRRKNPGSLQIFLIGQRRKVREKRL